MLYDGIIWTNYVHSEDPESLKDWYEQSDESFMDICHYFKRHIGNTYVQKIESLTEQYTAYNVKSRRSELTSFERIMKYIMKQVNSNDLIRFINRRRILDKIISNKKSRNGDVKTTPVLTDLNNEQLLEPSMMDIDAFNKYLNEENLY